MKLAVAYSEDVAETMGVTKSKEFGFSKDAEEIIFSMFTKNIYSNPIGSVVREITSNCFDSHKEAGVNEPVVIRLSRENSNYYVSFKDVGMGMSPDRINKVYSQYFNSTKRGDNNQIGGFGIGGKTPLAYAESFFLITIFDGIKYTYGIRKGVKSPVLDLMSKDKTKEGNGTTIKIPVKDGDVGTFEYEMQRQLYYFENVIFEGFSDSLKNDYQIIEAEHFLYRGNTFSNVHICLGRVAYPIDFGVLGLNSSSWSVPVALKMNIGDVNVTVSREAIDYTEETKKLIKRKLDAIKDELRAMLAKQHANINNLNDYYAVVDEPNKLHIGSNLLDLSRLGLGFKAEFKKLSGINIPTQLEIIDMFYDHSRFGKPRKREMGWSFSAKNIGYEKVYKVHAGQKLNRRQNAYMKSFQSHFHSLWEIEVDEKQMEVIVEKVTPSTSILPLDEIEKLVKVLQTEVYTFVDASVKKYDDVKVPDGYSPAKTKYDPNTELPMQLSCGTYLSREKIKMKNILESKALIYYGTADDKYLIEKYLGLYVSLFPEHKHESMYDLRYTGEKAAMPIRFAVVAKNNMKHMATLDRARPVADFAKVLKRRKSMVITSLEKSNFMEKTYGIETIFTNSRLFAAVDLDLSATQEKYRAIYNKYHALKTDIDRLHDAISFYEIDRSTITFEGQDVIETILEAQRKNRVLLNYVNIPVDFDPLNSKINTQETQDILNLLSLVYVK